MPDVRCLTCGSLQSDAAELSELRELVERLKSQLANEHAEHVEFMRQELERPPCMEKP
jgi:hypothetical protein